MLTVLALSACSAFTPWLFQAGDLQLYRRADAMAHQARCGPVCPAISLDIPDSEHRIFWFLDSSDAAKTTELRSDGLVPRSWPNSSVRTLVCLFRTFQACASDVRGGIGPSRLNKKLLRMASSGS